MVIFHSYVNVYQRVPAKLPFQFLSFSLLVKMRCSSAPSDALCADPYLWGDHPIDGYNQCISDLNIP